MNYFLNQQQCNYLETCTTLFIYLNNSILEVQMNLSIVCSLFSTSLASIMIMRSQLPVVEIMPRIDVCRKQNHYWSTCQLLTIGLLISSVILFYSAIRMVTKFGSSCSADGQFTDPENLAVDSDGNVYVTDRKNNNIHVFKPVN